MTDKKKLSTNGGLTGSLRTGWIYWYSYLKTELGVAS